MHDGTIQQADTCLENHLEAYRQWAMSNDSLLIVTWDEDDHKTANHIATIFVGAMVRPGRYAETINHFNVLRTLEDMYGLPAAGKSADATPITDVWTTSPGQDCNQNGVADSIDIANGTSMDENKDGIPDECQSAQLSVPKPEILRPDKSANLCRRLDASGEPEHQLPSLLAQVHGQDL